MEVTLIDIDPDAWDGSAEHSDVDWHSYSSGIHLVHSRAINKLVTAACKSAEELEAKIRKLEFEFILEVSEFLQTCIRNWVYEYLLDSHPEVFDEAEKTFKAYLRNKEFSLTMKSSTSVYKLYFYLSDDTIEHLDFKRLLKLIKPKIEIKFADAAYILSLANVEEILIGDLSQDDKDIVISFGLQDVKLTHRHFAYQYMKDDSIECVTSPLNTNLEFNAEINGQLSTILGIDLSDAELVDVNTDQVIPQAHIKNIINECLQFGIRVDESNLKLSIQQAFDMACSQIDLRKDSANPLGEAGNSNLGMIFANDFACYAKLAVTE